MRIAVDALGGDNAPREVVAGALAAAGGLAKDEIFLVGDRSVIEPEVRTDVPPNVSLRDAGGAVGMDEEPAAALRSRPDASISVAAEMVRAGEAEALFSAGKTGATVAAGVLRVGRPAGCRRAAVATVPPLSAPG